jgi:glyoxylase-like metal-dependent hydrolase (beta-lactamase superfamily II)
MGLPQRPEVPFLHARWTPRGAVLPVWICETCGNHFPDSESAPGACVICADERQWVPPSGQRWTTLADLSAAGHRGDVREVEPGLIGIGVDPPVAIGQRALLVTTPEGNLLWDPPGFIDEAMIQAVGGAGGLRAVAASHPHFYGAIAEWSRAFEVEILLPEADAHWLTRPSRAVRTWSGSLPVLPGVILVQCGGHFAGSAVVHWSEGAEGAGVLLSGDTIFVTPGEDRVTFVRSAPNRLPLPEQAVRAVVDAVRRYRFDRIYAGWWEPVLHRNARQVLESSAERYIQWLRGEVPLE